MTRIPTHPGSVIKEELEVRHISQKYFAELTGISYSSLNDFLNEKKPLSSELALIIEAALGVSADLLMNMQNRYNMALPRQKPSFLSRLSEIRKACAVFM